MASPVAFLNRLMGRGSTGGEMAMVAATLAVAKVFEPLFDNAAQAMAAQFGDTLLTPDQLAAAVHRGELAQEEAEAQAEQGGLQPGRFRTLVRIAEPLLDAGMMMAALNKGTMAEESVREELRRSGWESVRIEALLRSRFNPPPAGTVLDMLNRGTISEGVASDRLRASGLAPEDIASVLALRKVIPPITDLIRFTVREAFNDSFASRFGLDEEFPSGVVQFAGQQGLSEEWVRRYWRAHWELPSPSQGFAMYHRGLISRPDLEALLKASDYSPAWREQMLGISYNPLTRVDIRRMYHDGVLNREEVLRANLDIGYSPENAERLTKWVTAEKMTEEKALTKAEVIKGYNVKAIDRAGALAMLDSLGYQPEEAAMILDIADHQESQRLRDKRVNAVRTRYLAHKLERFDVATTLDSIGVSSSEREALLEEWTVDREAVQADLTVSQWGKLLKMEIVSPEEHKTEMIRRGYSDREADLLAILVLGGEEEEI